jgi:hypothetical protein
MHVAARFDNLSHQNGKCLPTTYQGCVLPSFGSFGQAVSEEKIFLDQSEK